MHRSIQPAVLLLIFLAITALSDCTIAFVIIVSTQRQQHHPSNNRLELICFRPITATTKAPTKITATTTTTTTTTTTALYYEPKWKKKMTLAEELGINSTTVSNLKEIGIIGTIPVRFVQGNVTKTTMALPNQPLREVAIQAGQFIKYGCGKGECGTCEALVNGQWVRPCICTVPSVLEPNQEYYSVQVKEVKNKARSSGKFYSVRSFLYGFYNNVLGMIGMVTYKRNAKQNYLDRMEYENFIKQKALEKKRLKALQEQQQAQTQN